MPCPYGVGVPSRDGAKVGQVANLSYAQSCASQEMRFLRGLRGLGQGSAGVDSRAKARKSRRDLSGLQCGYEVVGCECSGCPARSNREHPRNS